MPIKYNIDALLEEKRPVVVFRGREYRVKDHTVKETINSVQQLKQKENKLLEKQRNRVRSEVVDEGFEEDEVEEEVSRRIDNMDPHEAFIDLLPVAVESLVEALEGFPSDIDITMTEFNALRQAIQKAHSQVYELEGVEDGDVSKKK